MLRLHILGPNTATLTSKDFRINLLVSLPFPFFQDLPIFENGMNHLKVSSTTEKKNMEMETFSTSVGTWNWIFRNWISKEEETKTWPEKRSGSFGFSRSSQIWVPTTRYPPPGIDHISPPPQKHIFESMMIFSCVR